MKKILLLSFCLCVLNDSYAKSVYTSVYKTGCYDVDITNVVRTDTATIIELQCVQNPGDEFWPSNAPLYLSDEKQNRYPLRRAEGITLGKMNIHPYSGVLKFSLVFEPLPKDVKVFDLLSNYRKKTAFAFWGVHKVGQKLNGVKHVLGDKIFQNEFVMTPGIVKIRGKIEDYKSYSSIDTLMVFNVPHVGKTRQYSSYDAVVDSTGRFEFELFVDNTMLQYVVGCKEHIPVMLNPGDTLSISVSHWGEYNMVVDYKSALGYDVMAGLMAVELSVRDFELYDKACEKIRPSKLREEMNLKKAENAKLNDYLTWKYKLSEVEAHLLLLSFNSGVDAAAIKRLDKNVRDFFMHEKRIYSVEKLQQLLYDDSEVNRSYDFVSGVNANDYSYFVLPDQSLVNALSGMEPVWLVTGGRESMFKALERLLGQSLDEEWRKRICF